jgi:hypothetical protein
LRRRGKMVGKVKREKIKKVIEKLLRKKYNWRNKNQMIRIWLNKRKII